MDTNIDSDIATNFSDTKEIFTPTILLIGGGICLTLGSTWLFGGKVWNYFAGSASKLERNIGCQIQCPDKVCKENDQRAKKKLEIVWRSFTSENLGSHMLTEEHENDLPHYVARYWIPHLRTETGHETPLLYVPDGCEF